MKISQAIIFLAKETNRPLAEKVKNHLYSHNCNAQIITSFNDFKAWDPVGLLISLGGDGTLLKCMRYAAPHQIPVFGINCGTLGFLAACEKEDACATLAQFLEGSCTIQQRPMLQVKLFLPGKSSQFFTAFNDCILRAAAPRTLMVSAAWNDTKIPPYYGDGVIISTPTGSTAYSLAAGGPIVEPSVHVFVVTPICPHSLHQRPLVLPADGKLQLTPVLDYAEDRALLSLDGQTNLSLEPGARLEIQIFKHPALLVCPPKRDFFTVLNRKLNWGERTC